MRFDDNFIGVTTISKYKTNKNANKANAQQVELLVDINFESIENLILSQVFPDPLKVTLGTRP